MSERLKKMKAPCPVCGCVLTGSMDMVARWEVERARDPDGSRDRLIARLREKGMDGLAERVALFDAEPAPDPEGELQSVYAHLRSLVAASEVGDWKHAIQGLLPEGFGENSDG
jgi:hypothetical protein